MHEGFRGRDALRAFSAIVWAAGAVVLVAVCFTAAGYLVRSSVPVALDAPGGGLAAVVAGLALVTGGCLAVATARRLGQEPRRWPVIVFGLSLLVGIRLVAILLVDAPLVSDYSVYWGIANGIREGDGFWTSVPPGYPFAGALAILLLGPPPSTGEVLNLVLATVGGIAVYLLAVRTWGNRAAAVSLTVYAIVPSHVLHTLILGTEVTYGVTLAVIAALIVRAGRGGAWFGALAGIAIGIGQYVRPTSQFLVPVAIVVVLLAVSQRRASLKVAGALILGFAVTVTPIAAWNATVNQRLSVSPSLYDGWTMLAGLNVGTSGQYNQADIERALERAGLPRDLEGVTDREQRFSATYLGERRLFNEAAGDLAFERLVANGIRGNARLQLAKFTVMWERGDYPVTFVFGSQATVPSPDATAILGLVSQLAWILLAAGGLAYLWRGRRDRPIAAATILCFVLVTVATHSLAEVQPRYHEYLVPLLCVLVGAGFGTSRPVAPDDPLLPRSEELGPG
jgi:4-amino-4-deoxy-L-arabinose transferase-like glycosyltransferase